MIPALKLHPMRKRPTVSQRRGPQGKVATRHSSGSEGSHRRARNAPKGQVAATRAEQAAEAPTGVTATARLAGWKRCLDIICIALSLPLVLPLMVLVLLWIKLVSRGPGLLRQMRIGRHGKPFVLYKFRSMRLNSSTQLHEAYVRGLVEADRPLVKLELVCDSRLIAGGCMLRAAGLDELPQLLNVLRGEMSLVGPRPCLPAEYDLFTPRQRERFEALPGLTGLWQVKGKNHTTFREMNAMDIDYVRNGSVLVDLDIMLRTPAALLRQIVLAYQLRNAALRRMDIASSSAATGRSWPPSRHRHSP